MVKKVISLLLVTIFMFCSITVAFAEETGARLYTVYGNSMLFEQSKAAIFAGEGKPGSVIRAQLLNENHWPVRTASGKVSDDGTFEISFIAPAGSYDKYTVELTQDGNVFAMLENVVFGELWLASGQSNMMYPLIQSEKGMEMFNNNQLMSEWLRVLIEPAYPTYNGTNEIPVDPQNDIESAKWYCGNQPEAYSMSAVTYFFAEELMKELDMPVGILNSSLGGSSIRSWLSREAIDADSTLKDELKSNGLYIEKADWSKTDRDIYNDMSANYNLRTHAYRNFRPSGLIWYQGETDLLSRNGFDLYEHSFNALQQIYTDMFDCRDKLFPMIYTQIAPFDYGENALAEWNFNYTKMQAAQNDSRAMITLYDLPLTYITELGVIHPATKLPVGQRMASAALSLVYGENSPHTAASLDTSEIKDSSIYVTFKNTGGGIKADGNTLSGFAICGEDGIFVQAEAEIVSENTVKIRSEYIKKPVAASYAYSTLNTYSNLYTTVDGEMGPDMPFEMRVVPKVIPVFGKFDQIGEKTENPLIALWKNAGLPTKL